MPPKCRGGRNDSGSKFRARDGFEITNIIDVKLRFDERIKAFRERLNRSPGSSAW